MGAAATFYLDGPSFEEATTVFTDASLTTCAPNGFYQIGNVVREQVDCTAGLGGRLLPQTACPTCGSPPTTAPPTPTPTASPTPTITQPPALPLYYKLLSCPITQGSSLKYTSITPSTSSPSQRYQDSTQSPPISYVYDNSAGTTTPPQGTISNIIQIVPGEFGCPAVAAEYNFYNAIECDNVTAVVIRSDEATTFVAGQVVKTVGSSVCYSIQTVAASTTTFLTYDTSVSPFDNCDLCNPAPPPINGFKVTQSGQPDNEVLQDVSNPYTERETVLTSINSECWTLSTPINTSTGNTITSPCPTVPECTEFYVSANLGTTATINGTRCGGTSPASQLNIPPGDASGTLCYITSTISITNGTQVDAKPCTATPPAPSDPYDYYNLQKCDGTGSTIVARRNGAPINNGQSVKISSVCYQVISTSTDNSTTTDIVGSEIYTSCSACDPCAGISTLSLSYNANQNCTTSGVQNLRTNGTTLLSSSLIYQPTGACDSTNYAPTGWYTQITASGSSSKFWNGVAFTQTISPCPTAPTTVTATLSDVDNQIVGPTAGYTIAGNVKGDTIKAPFGGSTAFAFNTTVTVNNGYTFSPGPTVTNFSGTLTNTDLSGPTTLEGTVTQNAPAFFYQIRQCGTSTLYNIEASSTYYTGNVVRFLLLGSGSTDPTCGEIIGTPAAGSSVDGTIMYNVPNGCNDYQCTGTFNPL